MLRPAVMLLLVLATPLAASVAEDVDWGVRSLPAPLAVDRLRELVTSGPLSDRLEALRLVAGSGRLAVRPVLLDAAGDRQERVAIDALRHLGQLGPGFLSEDAQMRLNLARTEPMVRLAALDCVAAWGERRFVPDLATLLASEVPPIRTQVAEALTRLTGERLGVDPEAWKSWYSAESTVVGERLDTLRRRFADPDQAIDEPTVASLGAMRGHTSEAVELLRPLLRDSDPRVVAAVVRTLRVIRPALVRELDPALLAELPAQPTAAAAGTGPAVAPAPLRPPAPATPAQVVGNILIVVLVMGALFVAGWLWLRLTHSGRKVAGHATRMLAAVGQGSGAVVVRLKGRSHLNHGPAQQPPTQPPR